MKLRISNQNRYTSLLALLFFLLTSTPTWLNLAMAQQPASQSLVKAIDSVGFTVSHVGRSVEFFSKTLSFEKVSYVKVTGDDYEHLQVVFGLRMWLGDELIELTEYLAPRGCPIPLDSRSIEVELPSAGPGCTRDSVS